MVDRPYKWVRQGWTVLACPDEKTYELWVRAGYTEVVVLSAPIYEAFMRSAYLRGYMSGHDDADGIAPA